MDKEIVQAWEENKGKMRTWFSSNIMQHYDEYIKIVEKLFSREIMPSLYLDTDRITEIDDGEYGGTKIFIIPRDTYQPTIEDYIYTCAYYGTCSACDTLESIIEYDYDKYPTDKQVDELMTLCLHLVQKAKYLVSQEE